MFYCEHDGCAEEGQEYLIQSDGANKTLCFCDTHASEFGFCPGCGYFVMGAEEHDRPLAQYGLCAECLDDVRADSGEFEDDSDEEFIY
jgi:hypothetical protein